MGGLSAVHWAVVCLAALLLFGKGRLPDAMGDIGKGLKKFRAELTDEQDRDV